MSWHGGTQVMYAVIMSIRDKVKSDEDKLAIFSDVWEALSDQDWAGAGELLGVDPVFDQLLKSSGHMADEEDETGETPVEEWDFQE